MSDWKDSWNASAIPQGNGLGNGRMPSASEQPRNYNSITPPQTSYIKTAVICIAGFLLVAWMFARRDASSEEQRSSSGASNGVCQICDGSGAVDCPRKDCILWDGKHVTFCEVCHGLGTSTKFVPETCSFGLCEACNGNAKKLCPTCGGSNKMPCPTCHGRRSRSSSGGASSTGSTGISSSPMSNANNDSTISGTLNYAYCMSQARYWQGKANTQQSHVNFAKENLDKNPLMSSAQQLYTSAVNLYNAYLRNAEEWRMKAVAAK